MLMTVLTALLALVLYNIAKNEDYSEAIIIFIISFPGAAYQLLSPCYNKVLFFVQGYI